MGWEMIIIYIMLAAAAAYLIWFLFFPKKKRSPCTGCQESGSCKKDSIDKRTGMN